MSIETFFRDIGKKFDAFIDETKMFIGEKILKKKPSQLTENTEKVTTAVLPQKNYTGYVHRAPSYAQSGKYELLIREKINLLQEEYAKTASEDFVDRLAKIFNSSNFRSNPWLYIDRWKEQKKRTSFSEMEQLLALDFFENKLLKGMCPINLAPLDPHLGGMGTFDLPIKELFETPSFQENPFLFIKTLEKQQKKEDQEIVQVMKKHLCIESIKLDMTYLQEKAANYKDDDNNPQEDTIAVLANKLFQKNPALFMENWIKQRGPGENWWCGEDDAKYFFQKHLAVTSLSVGELLNEIQKEPMEIRTVLKKILYNPIFQRHPLQFLEQLGNKPLSEVENTARTWFLSKFDPAPVETKDTVKIKDIIEAEGT